MRNLTKAIEIAGLAAVLVALLPVCAAGQVKRQRIALNGYVSYGAIGVPKWSADRTTHNYGEQGDMILLSCEAKPNERLTVGGYLEYCDITGNSERVNNWRVAPASNIGREWGYESESLSCVGNWARMTNPSSDKATYAVHLFVPHDAVGLPSGSYGFRYRIRVWANGSLVDDFNTDENRIGIVQDSGQVREGIAICAAPNGPSISEVRLEGTDDPDK